MSNKIDEKLIENNREGQSIRRAGYDFIINNSAYIILFLNIAFEILSSLYTAGIVNPFTPDFFFEVTKNILTTMIVYVIFVKRGQEIERHTLPEFKANWSRWITLSREVRNGKNEAFIAFCRAHVEDLRENKRRSIILNRTMLSYDTYCKEYNGKTKEYVDKLYKDGIISKAERNAINKANANIKMHQINPIGILCGVDGKRAADVGDGTMDYSIVSIASRPVLVFLASALMSMFTNEYIGITDPTVWLDMMYSVISIVLAGILGFDAGANAVHKENERLKVRIYFLENFLQKENIDLEKFSKIK